MTTVSTNQLLVELRRTLSEVDAVIDGIKSTAEKRIAILPYPEEHSVYTETDRNGRPILAEMLTAKANLLAAITSLQTNRPTLVQNPPKR